MGKFPPFAYLFQLTSARAKQLAVACATQASALFPIPMAIIPYPSLSSSSALFKMPAAFCTSPPGGEWRFQFDWGAWCEPPWPTEGAAVKDTTQGSEETVGGLALFQALSNPTLALLAVARWWRLSFDEPHLR